MLIDRTTKAALALAALLAFVGLRSGKQTRRNSQLAYQRGFESGYQRGRCHDTPLPKH